MRSSVCILVAMGLSFCFVGCDSRPRRVPVAGQVTIDGQPLSTGFIRFIPSDGRAASSPLATDGSFQLTTYDDGDGCLLGNHGVEVIAVKNHSATTVEYLTPRKYCTAQTSGLKVNIEKPEPSLKIELTWAGEKPEVETSISEGDVPNNAAR